MLQAAAVNCSESSIRMQYSIQGVFAQTVQMTLSPGDICWASKGSLMALDPGVNWTLKIPGGLSGTVRRMLSGEGLALTYIQGQREGERVLLTANQPGKILAWDLADGAVVTTRGSFVAAFGPRIDIDVTSPAAPGPPSSAAPACSSKKSPGKALCSSTVPAISSSNCSNPGNRPWSAPATWPRLPTSSITTSRPPAACAESSSPAKDSS
jgi:hypothetical protein